MGSTYMQFAIIILLTGQLTNGHHWGYSTEEQAKWKEHYKSCGGHRQSPINIYDATGKRLNPFKLQNYRDPLPGPLMLHNNGHTVVLQIAHPRRGQSVPYITGGWLSKSYQFESLHFHWGERSDFGSEHTFTGKRYPMEMHMVHRNKNYRTMEEAMKHADGLMVLAFFYELRKDDNKQLDQLVKHLPRVYAPHANITLTETFALASLIPSSEKMRIYYTYKGSLTTPPCSEVVTWIVYPNPMPVSEVQLNKFRSMFGHDTHTKLTNNFRYVQDIGSREVIARIPRIKPPRPIFKP
ncbi:carbonic anhydrase 15-like isoform X1 [Agrilus planipennis]|uniref:carbonic anhydrase n=1 Tax=Agrilus planipennis TaxID=224129 RepID=A0A1W4WVW2_AGRPL|nr:carbonic anhydrase 15-like isoform X1 [Agrilus planipennis]